MKKLSYFLLVALVGMAFASCEREKKDFIQDIVYPKIEPLAAVNYNAAAASADFPEIKWSDADFGFGAEVAAANQEYTVELSTAASNFADIIELGKVKGATSFKIKVGALNTVLLKKNFALSPVDMRIRVKASIYKDAKPVYTDALSFTVTPFVMASPALTLAGESTVFAYKYSERNMAFPAISWTAADYGFAGDVTYKLQVAEAGKSFANAIELSNGADMSKAMTVKDMNDKLVAAGFAPKTAVNLEMRVVASIVGSSVMVPSNVVALTFTPFAADAWGIIGHAVPVTGWNSDVDMVYNDANNTWSITIDLQASRAPNDGFKFRANDAWTVNRGDNGGDGTLEHDGTNIDVAEAGNYTITANFDEGTYTMKKNSWGIIGAGVPVTGWGSSVPMTYDAATLTFKLRTALNQSFAPSDGIKFRANDEWAMNLGDNDADGTMEFGGQNITVPETGLYDITLNVTAKTYSLTLVPVK